MGKIVRLDPVGVRDQYSSVFTRMEFCLNPNLGVNLRTYNIGMSNLGQYSNTCRHIPYDASRKVLQRYVSYFVISKWHEQYLTYAGNRLRLVRYYPDGVISKQS